MANTVLLVVFAVLQVMCFFSFLEVSATTCRPSGFLPGKLPKCFAGNDCCLASKHYPQFRCSPPVTKTPSILTVNIFESGEAETGLAFCDNRFHSNRELVVSMSSGWLILDGTFRCNRKIRISANGRSVLPRVVDECDSINGCDRQHDFEPPCRNNVVGGPPAVWKALGLNESIGELKVTWSDV